MKKLTSPNFDAKTTFDLCVSTITAGSFKDRLDVIAAEIKIAETGYLQKASETALFSIKGANAVGAVTKDEMKKVYKNTFVKSKKTRHIYDTIKKTPKNDICPLCSQRTVSTLDHYLAQDHHPALVVTPINLVPACAECNKQKLNAQPKTANDQTFHPYFDDFDDDRWLYGLVEQTAPARTVFTVKPPDHWPELKKKRAQKHFSMLQLGALYGSHSASELTNIRHFLDNLLKSGSSETVREFLKGMAHSASLAHRNSWQAATYDAFSASSWFCAGGFRNV